MIHCVEWKKQLNRFDYWFGHAGLNDFRAEICICGTEGLSADTAINNIEVEGKGGFIGHDYVVDIFGCYHIIKSTTILETCIRQYIIISATVKNEEVSLEHGPVLT